MQRLRKQRTDKDKNIVPLTNALQLCTDLGRLFSYKFVITVIVLLSSINLCGNHTTRLSALDAQTHVLLMNNSLMRSNRFAEFGQISGKCASHVFPWLFNQNGLPSSRQQESRFRLHGVKAELPCLPSTMYTLNRESIGFLLSLKHSGVTNVQKKRKGRKIYDYRGRTL